MSKWFQSSRFFTTLMKHHKSKPFFYHVVSFCKADDWIWIHNYQVRMEFCRRMPVPVNPAFTGNQKSASMKYLLSRWLQFTKSITLQAELSGCVISNSLFSPRYPSQDHEGYAPILMSLIRTFQPLVPRVTCRSFGSLRVQSEEDVCSTIQISSHPILFGVPMPSIGLKDVFV